MGFLPLPMLESPSWSVCVPMDCWLVLSILFFLSGPLKLFLIIVSEVFLFGFCLVIALIWLWVEFV